MKTSRTLFSLLQLEVSLEHRLVVGGELFHGGGGTLGLFGWGCASGTLEPLAYTYTRAAQTSRQPPPPPPPPPLSSVAVFQKLLRSLAKSSQNKTDLLLLYFWVATPSFPSLDSNLQPIDQFPGKWYPILDLNSLYYIPYTRVNCLKTIPCTAAHTCIAVCYKCRLQTCRLAGKRGEPCCGMLWQSPYPYILGHLKV